MEKTKGMLNYNEREYPFYFEDGILSLLPPNQEVLNEDQDTLFEQFLQKANAENKQEFIGRTFLYGTTYNNKEIIFEVSDNASNNNGYITFNVHSYFVLNIAFDYDDDFKNIRRHKNSIYGVRISGREIDYICNPARAYKHKLQELEDNSSCRKITVETNSGVSNECGTIIMNDTLVNVSLNTNVTLHFNAIAPLTSRSEIAFDFQQPVDIEFVQELIHPTLRCLCYMCRRKNISLNEIRIMDRDENGLYREFGKYNLLRKHEDEPHAQARERVIPVDYIKDEFSSLLQVFIEGIMYIQHLPSSIDNSRSYGADRIIFDFVAFEREYRNIYPEKEERSQEYQEVKQDLLNAVDELIESKKYTGLRKKHMNTFKKTIEKSENGFGVRLSKAIKRYEDLLQPFLIQGYGKSYADEIESICDRMNALRNDSAHGNLDLQIVPEHLNDLRLVEQLLYAMRLKKCGTDTNNIQKAINDLFRCNIAI